MKKWNELKETAAEIWQCTMYMFGVTCALGVCLLALLLMIGGR